MLLMNQTTKEILLIEYFSSSNTNTFLTWILNALVRR